MKKSRAANIRYDRISLRNSESDDISLYVVVHYCNDKKTIK